MEEPTLESVKRNPLRLTCNAINPMLTPAKKFDLPTEVISNELIAENHYLLRCSCPEIAASVLPGQFIHVLIPQGSGLLLRPPVYDLHR